jgi:hypothetical protein
MVVSHSRPDPFQNFYDQKQYKQALRNGEQIMENNKDHAGKPSQTDPITETDAFKCLILTKLKRSKEAFEGIKRVLFKNLTNFTCWHVYGLI